MIALFVIGIVPLIWSAVIFGVRQMTDRHDIPQDQAEKLALALMLMPILLGVCLIILVHYMPVTVTLPVLTYAGLDDGTAQATSATAITAVRPHMDWPTLSLSLASAIYLVIAASGVGRLLWAQFRLCRVVATSSAAPEMGEGVRLTSVVSSAFVFGRSIILPHHLLDKITPTQAALIISHERAHLSRGDALYFVALSWIDALLWFNPFVRHQTRRGRLAAELACDAAVACATSQMRKVYAASLLLALKHTAGDLEQCAPAAISSNAGEYQVRLNEIMRASPPQRKTRGVMLCAAAFLILPLAGLQLTWAQTLAPVKTAKMVVPKKVGAMPILHAPLHSIFTIVPTAGKLISGFGMRIDPVTHRRTLHDGVDIAAAVGTAVYAPASGKVTFVDMPSYGYGHTLEIDHGNGLVTRYIHLSDILVHLGEQVQAGQLVAKSGNTGRSTGPHTHIGVFKNGKAIDPATVMPLPSASQ